MDLSEVRSETAVVVEPPDRSLRYDQVGRAGDACLEEKDDRSLVVSGMVPRVLARIAAGEVAPGRGAGPEQLLVAATHDQYV